MNFMKRALQYLWAKKGRSLLLIAVLSTIMIFVLAGLTIYSAAKVATDNAKKSVGATVTLTVNRENMFKNSTTTSTSTSTSTSSSESESKPDPGSFSRTPINLTDAQKIAKLAGIKSYVFTASTSANQSDGIEPISSSETTTSSSTTSSTDANTGASKSMGGENQGDDKQMQQGDFRIQGVSTSANYDSFSSGTAKLIKGSGITAEDENTNNVLIEKSLAEANDLSVGDTFKIKNANDEDVTVTIKGIYETTDTGDSMGMQFNFMNPSNTIISSYTFIATIKDDGEDISLDSAVYTLEDPKEMSSFVKKAEKLIDTDTFSLQTNDQMYQQMLQPLNNVASFAKNIVLLVAVAGIVILTLLVMMSIRERRYEIGVLLSLGEARFKIIGQFFIELLVCMIFALGIAGVSGNLVGNAVGNQLLAQQTTSQANNQSTNQQTDRPNGGPGERGGMRQQMQSMLSASNEVKKLNITVKPKQIASLAGIGLGISLLSILIAATGILRLNPKKILID